MKETKVTIKKSGAYLLQGAKTEANIVIKSSSVELYFRDLKLSDKKINDLIMNKSKLWLDSGLIFGQSGRGFQRINVATNRKKINILLERLTKTFKDF